MKHVRLFVAIAAAAYGISFSASAQIPVTDVAAITESTIQHGENIAKWLEAIQKYQAQIDQMKQQYEALTGSRGFGDILNNPEYANYLPEEWQYVYRSVQNGGYEGLTGSAKAIRDANKLFDSCAVLTGVDRTVCQRQASKAAQDKAFASGAFDKAKERWGQIAGLVGQINGTSDPKAIAELQARIAGEQAALQNEQTKLQMYQMIAAAEDRLIEQQQREANAKSLARRGYVTPVPVNFGE